MSGDSEQFIDPSTARSTEFVQAGSELAGAVVGGALGLIGGPPGVLAGAAGGVVTTRVLKRVGSEIQERVLGPRQRIRAGAAFAYAADEIHTRLAAGEMPRTDGFFADDASRSSADELLEGVLTAAADAFEERKVRHYGWLYASLVFDSTVDPLDANYLLRLARGLTYRQLCAVAFFVDPRPSGVLALLDGAREGGVAGMSDGLALELDDLGQNGFIGFLQEGGHTARPSATLGGGDFRAIALARIGATAVGQQLYRLMRLERVPDGDLVRLRIDLGGLG